MRSTFCRRLLFVLLGMVQPLPAYMHKVQINLATGKWAIQGKVLSVNAEATYRVWLAKILLLGEELYQSQWWWVEFDDKNFALFPKVNEERKNETYNAALGDAVKDLLAHYAPSADENGSGNEGEPEAKKCRRLINEEWQTQDR